MKAIRLYGQSGPDQFVFEDVPQPQPGVGEVLIRVHATSVMWQEPTWSETWQTPAGIERQHPMVQPDAESDLAQRQGGRGLHRQGAVAHLGVHAAHAFDIERRIGKQAIGGLGRLGRGKI